GLGDVDIGDTVCCVEAPEPLAFVNIDEPTISMTFRVNNSPFAGREGSLLTSRHIRDRLFREVKTNVSMRVEETDAPDAFTVSGRGELHLSILIETMRREGYEFSVSKPAAVFRETESGLLEPIELLITDAPDEATGVIIEKLGARKAEMVNMRKREGGYTRLEFEIPARGLIGFRSEFLTDTRGNGIMNHVFQGFGPYRGALAGRPRGALIAWENGEASAYGLNAAQERGVLFIAPGASVYEGMVVGECSRDGDMAINVCKKKHATNIRAAGSDDAVRLTPPRVMSLEQALEFIEDDELIEVTPKNMRIRKSILNTEQRLKFRSKAQHGSAP
ncbi:MAG: translational GTPase TypA, partial [Oscillospiraceae bacterium]|nr:translational GTPase TypA [Oscillospiraceae bacterium]